MNGFHWHICFLMHPGADVMRLYVISEEALLIKSNRAGQAPSPSQGIHTHTPTHTRSHMLVGLWEETGETGENSPQANCGWAIMHVSIPPVFLKQRIQGLMNFTQPKDTLPFLRKWTVKNENRKTIYYCLNNWEFNNIICYWTILWWTGRIAIFTSQ